MATWSSDDTGRGARQLVTDRALDAPGSDETARPGSRAGRWVASWPLLGILLLSAVLYGIHAIVGGSYILDDWYALRNVHFGGPSAAADPNLRAARPGSALTFGLSFGYAHSSQLAMLVIRGSLMLAAAVLGYFLLKRFFSPVVCGATIGLWILLPNHLSLELWSSAMVANVSLVLLLAGCLLIARDPVPTAGLVAACVCFGVSSLTYESSILPAALAVVALPWLAGGRPRWRVIIAGWATLAAVVLWILTHWFSEKSAQNDVLGYMDVLQAHFGWGILQSGLGARIGFLAGLVGLAVVIARVVLPSQRGRAGAPEALACAGLVVMIAGSVTFALYFYAPLGAGDRVSYLSSLGGAMVWVGLIWMVGRRWRGLAAGAAVLLVAGSVSARVERTEIWRTAASDSDRIVEAIHLTDPSCTVVYVGPAPIQQQNVAAFVDQSNVDAAVQVVLGDRDVRGVMTFDERAFDKAPAECRVDIRPLSELEPDVVVGPT